MLVRTLSLLAVPVLTVLLAPREASACSPPEELAIQRAYPADGATEVPIDGVVVIAGAAYSAPDMLVVVKRGDTEIEGTVEMVDSEHYVWRSAAPLLPHATYSLHVEVLDEWAPESLDSTFTTGPASAPAPGPALLVSASVAGYDHEIKECIDGEEGSGDCGQCAEWKILDVEHRMHLTAGVVAPEGPFDGYYIGRVAYGPSADMLGPAAPRLQPAAGADIMHGFDLGIAGEWPSDEVCVRVELGDPLGTFAQGEVSCVDVSAINIEVEDEDPTGGPDTGDTDDTPMTTGDTEDGGDTEGLPEDDGKLEGCSCRGGDRSAWPGALLLLAVGLLRPGRRRR